MHALIGTPFAIVASGAIACWPLPPRLNGALHGLRHPGPPQPLALARAFARPAVTRSWIHGLLGLGEDPRHLEERLAAGRRAVDALDAGIEVGADRADRPVQHRFLRAPAVRQPGERPERRRVLEMERQLLIVSWRCCLSTAQRSTASAGSPCRPVALTPSWHRSTPTRLDSSRWSSSHADIALSSRPISCPANRSDRLAWTVRSGRIVGSGGCGLWLWNQ